MDPTLRSMDREEARMEASEEATVAIPVGTDGGLKWGAGKHIRPLI